VKFILCLTVLCSWSGAFAGKNPSQAGRKVKAAVVQLKPPEKFIANLRVQQCVAPLPVVGWMGFDHTWLTVDNISYGMPFSFTHGTVLGGYSSIFTPDPSLPKLDPKPLCRPVYQPENIDPTAFVTKVNCLLSKLSDSYNVLSPQWQPVFVYDWSRTNCHAAARFIADCAGGALSLNPNDGLGSHYPADENLNVWIRNPKNLFYAEAQVTQDLFVQFLTDLDHEIATHGDISALISARVPAIETEAKKLMEELSSSEELRPISLYRRLEKFVFNLKRTSETLKKSDDRPPEGP
jgi:hypothetical protein